MRTQFLVLVSLLMLGLAGCIQEGNNSQIGEQSSVRPPKVQTQSTSKTEYICPNLATNVNLQGYTAAFQSWTAKASPYKSDNVEIFYTYSSASIIYCDIGSSEGQSANLVYCGDFLRPIVAQYTDQGTIVKRRNVEVTFDKNSKQYVATNCDTY